MEEHIEKVKNTCEIAGILQTQKIRMFSFYIPDGKYEEYRNEVIDRLGIMLDIADEYGVKMCHENERGIYGDNAPRCLEILKAVPELKCVFDPANFVQCGENTAECWELLKEHVAYIHIKDAVAGKNENVVCGTGDGKIPQLLKKAIREDGYEGFLTLEPHLVLFATLQSLEVVDATEVISENKAKDGAEGYSMQYNALCEILKAI